MMKNGLQYAGAVLLVTVSVCCGAVNSEFLPQWHEGDEWDVQATVLAPDGRPKTSDPSSYPTNMVFPYTFLYDYVQETGTYKYRVDRILNTNGMNTATIWMKGVTNVESMYPCDWTLEFDTNTVTLIKAVKHEEVHDETYHNIVRDTWWSHSRSRFAIVDFPKIPNESVSTNRWIKDPGSDVSVLQENVFTSTNVTIVMTHTNFLDGLDKRVTFVWPKNAKWWKTAKLEYGTNVVVSAERIDP